MKLIFATNNFHKLKEIRDLLINEIQVLSLNEIGFEGDIPEDYLTLEENASQKAHFIYNKFKINCFSDDTGLEVRSLNGEPGVFSARYSRVGSPRYIDLEITEGNIRKLLELMEYKDHREARFRTVISLLWDGTEYLFEGVVNGTITREKRGTNGFGYDPVFIPDGEILSFAEMESDRKNLISHRGKAIRKLVEFLNDSKNQ